MKQTVTFVQTRTSVVEFDTVEPIGAATLEVFANQKTSPLPPGAKEPGAMLSDITTAWKVLRSDPPAPRLGGANTAARVKRSRR